MELGRVLIILVFIFSTSMCCSPVGGRTHYHKKKHLKHSSIAEPPLMAERPAAYDDADPPRSISLPPLYLEPVKPGSFLNSTNSTSRTSPTPSPSPPESVNAGYGGNSTASHSFPSFPLPSPPDYPISGNYTNYSSGAAHTPEPSNVGFGGISTNSTASPPLSLPLPPSYHPISGNYTNSSIAVPPVSSLPLPPAPAPAPVGTTGNSSSSVRVLDVRTFGAIGDGVSDDTDAFKDAWDSACGEGPGIILVPRGYSFKIRSTVFAGPCHSELTLQVDGTIMPPNGPDEWPQNSNRRWWLVFYRADGFKLQGGGLIEGRGDKWWNLTCKPHQGVNGTTAAGSCDSPVALRFFNSSNLTVHGLRIQNSPQFHFRFDGCRNVTIDSISIFAPALSPNTDGIHVENSEMVRIYNSVISNGDDCVSIGAGSFNVDIRNITCGPSHGISIGSLGKGNTRACVANITVKDSVIKHSDNGVRIKTWQGGFGAVSAVSFEGIRMDTVRNPIIIDQYYCLTKPCKNQTSAVYVSDISYSNIKGTYDERSPPMHFACSDSVPCTNITLSGVELLPAKGSFISSPFCWNAYGSAIAAMLTIPPAQCILEGLPQQITERGTENKCY